MSFRVTAHDNGAGGDGEFIYQPTRPHVRVARSALRQVLGTFFGGSIEAAVVAHLADPASKLGKEDLLGLRTAIEQAKAKGE